MDDCIFCKVARGNIPCVKLYEDAATFAFLDIRPVNKGHTLVIPKQHYPDLYALPTPLMNNLMQTVQKIAVALSKISDGVNVGQNNGAAAGQVVFHAHFHVIPRYANDGLHHWPGHSYEQGEDIALAEKIKHFL